MNDLSTVTLSIVICTYNRSSLLAKTLDCLLLQVINNRCVYDIIVVDNNSTDDTSSVCSSYAEKFSCPFFYYLDPRQGKSFALNSGIELAKHDYILFLDDDVTFDNNLIDSVARSIKTYPDCSVFGGKIIPLLDSDCSMPAWVRQKEPHYNAEGPLGDHNKGESVKSYYQKDMSTPCGANFFVRKDIFSLYGKYKESLNKIVLNLPMAEDSEFCYRLKKNNVKMLYIPSVCVYHYTPKIKLTKNYFRKYILRMSRAYVHAAPVDNNFSSILGVPLYFFKKLLKKFVCYIVSLAKVENPGLRFSKELECLHMLFVIYWYFRDRKIIKHV